MNRVLVIGLDGGAPQLIEKWKDQLPNFSRMIDEGVFGTLKSTIPSLTCPAWNCFATGKSPEKLGIYGWTYLEPPHTPKLSSFSICDRTDTMYYLLSEAEKYVGLINIPLTYPPPHVNGFVISGFPIPKTSKNDYCFPPELINKIDQLSGGFETEPSLIRPQFKKSGTQGFTEELKRHEDKIFAITKHLMGATPWDFLMPVFTTPDRIQHFFWHFMDENHPRHPEKVDRSLSDTILDTYKRLDQILGDIFLLIDKDTYILIMSDHGFQPSMGIFFINKWLQQEGFLILKKGVNAKPWHISKTIINKIISSKTITRILARLGAFEAWMKFAPRIFGFNRLHLDFWMSEQLFDRIDWTRTRAIGLEGGIYLNKEILSQNEYEKVKKQIASSLRELKGPLVDQKGIIQVYTCEEMYGKHHLGHPPDLILQVLDGKYALPFNIDSDSLWQIPGSSVNTGCHALSGVMMAHGPQIKQGAKVEARIIDLAPTILHIFGLPIPGDMDGRVLKEIFEEGSELGTREVKYQAGDEKDRVKSKIKNLRRFDKI